MKRMTNLELDSRITQFIQRKSEVFPEIFQNNDSTARNDYKEMHKSLHAKHNLALHV